MNHPGIQHDVEEFIGDLLDEALRNPEVRSHIVEKLHGKHLYTLVDEAPTQSTEEASNGSQFYPEGRVKISTRKAAMLLGYHPKYLGRKASAWGLTKIYMSSRSCRYYLDEVEELANKRALLFSE